MCVCVRETSIDLAENNLYEVEFGFISISRKYIVESGCNRMQNPGSNLIEQFQIVRQRPTPNEDKNFVINFEQYLQKYYTVRRPNWIAFTSVIKF